LLEILLKVEEALSFTALNETEENKSKTMLMYAEKTKKIITVNHRSVKFQKL